MSYCINSNCSNRQNPDHLESCQACETKLLINERYQIIKPLRTGQAYNSEIFEVKDFNDGGTSKVLKCLAFKHKDNKFAELFEKEAQVLIWLSSSWQKHPGIPKVQPDGYFTVGLGNGFKKLQCLVMEKIEGQNLEQWIEENQPISQEQALNWLQQLVEILEKLHRQGLWHRDIKPSNIMLKPDGQLVLIDFGAVGVGETIIISTQYTPQEQIEGKTVPQSDFFALGRTFVYLLTGRHPYELPRSSKTEELIWQNQASSISNSLAQLINDLMAHLPIHRPQNTQEILQRIQAIKTKNEPRSTGQNITPIVSYNLSDITQLPSHTTNSITSYNPSELTQLHTKSKPQPRRFPVRVLWVGGATLLLGLAGTLMYQVLPCELLGNFKPCAVAFGEKLSLGEKILIPGSATPEKEKGVAAFRDGKYSQAVDWLEQARNNEKRDPETLIYLNNARIEAQKTQSYTIAVAVPLDTSPEGLNSGLEILRGVAQAQSNFNRNRKGAAIKVLIADDANNSAQAKKIAQALVQTKNVLAVVGHFTSDSTLAAAKVYKENQLVFVSPTSTSEDLASPGKSGYLNFFFRTVPNDRMTAQTLASYLSKKNNQQTAAIFYNPGSRYSDSLRDEFRASFNRNGGQIVDELDLSTPIINSGKAIDNAGKQGAKVLALFPNSQSLTLNKTIKLINANQCRHFMVGGDTVYTPEVLDLVGKDAITCLVIAVPWHSTDSPDQNFPKAAETLWGGTVSWRTALAYDAAHVLLTALEKTSQPSRSLVQQTLSNPIFKAIGVTGEIRFQRNGDRKNPKIQLVQVQLNKQGKPVFVPLPTIP